MERGLGLRHRMHDMKFPMLDRGRPQIWSMLSTNICEERKMIDYMNQNVQKVKTKWFFRKASGG